MIKISGSDVSFAIITGLSGAGKTQSMKALEDLDFFCIDNLPPSLLPQLVELHAGAAEHRKYAVAMDVRGKEYFGHLVDALNWLARSEYHYTVVFLECRDSVLVRRFSETRRQHPLSGAGSIYDSIALERRVLAPIRERAHIVLDTSDLKPVELKAHLHAAVMGTPVHEMMVVDVFSFGFKYGAPIDADIVFDVRFLPNPFYVRDLKATTGLEPACAAYVMESPMARSFMETFRDLIVSLIPYYSREGKGRLTIGIGCTGGQHRSVAIAEELGRQLAQRGVRSQVRHREITDRKLAIESGLLQDDAGDECDTDGTGGGNNGKDGDRI
ncbi:MAG: RNase adapter RapZ [Bacillota bacterium]